MSKNSYKPTNKGSPCPCCNKVNGNCRITESDFKLPYWAGNKTLKGDLILCITFRNDLTSYKYRGETSNGIWGKYISNELSEELSRQWTPPNRQNSNIDSDCQREIDREIEKRRQEILAQREKQRILEQKAEALEKKVLLPESDRDREIRKILSDLTISDRDYKELTNRGFKHSQILECDYKSIQIGQPLSPKISQLLAGVTADGMSLNNHVSGMILPIPNEKGQYVGWQYKFDVKEDKYRWPKTYVANRSYDITSKLKETLKMPLGYFRPRSKSPCKDVIALTESVGFKPRLTADRFNLLTLGASGGMFTSSPQTFERFLKSAKEELGTNNVVLYADAGSVKNPLVLNQYHKTTEFLKERGFNIGFGWWNQIDKEKGDIDEITLDTKIEQISPERYFKIAKQHCNWEPYDINSPISEVESRNSTSISTIYDKFASELSDARTPEQLQEVISSYQTKFGARFNNIKKEAWTQLDKTLKKNITDFIAADKEKSDRQQERVEAIVPVLATYLNTLKKHRVENYKSLIEYNPIQKTITYRCKNNPQEYLNAKNINGQWLNCGSNISKEKAEYFKQEAFQKVRQRQLIDRKKKLT